LTEQLSGFSGALPRWGSLAAQMSRGARLYLESAAGVELPGLGHGRRRYWLVSRGLCRFFRVPLPPHADRSRQLEAIALEIRRLSPFAQTGSHLHLAAGFASVWLWDEQATQAAGSRAGVDVARLRVLPETALRPAVPDGVRLVECLDGVEGQFWSGGGLSASRWWARLPDEHAWILFQRGASVPPEQMAASVPPPRPLGWLDRPWTRTRAASALGLPRLDLRLVAVGLAAVTLASYGYQGAQYWRVREDAVALAREVAARSAEVDPILTARTQALDNLKAIRAQHDLAHYPSQLALIATVADLLPKDNSHLDDWVYDRGQLEISIADDQPIDVVRLVRAMGGSGDFREVAADRTSNNNTVRLHANVVAR
jgi:hypothetical protein